MLTSLTGFTSEELNGILSRGGEISQEIARAGLRTVIELRGEIGEMNERAMKLGVELTVDH